MPDYGDSLDLKIILAFTNAYEDLKEKGELSGEQLDQVLSLIEDYRKYTAEEFKKKLEAIF